MRVVLSLGGSIIGSDINGDIITDYIRAINSFVESGHEIHIVTGGGPLKEKFAELGRAIGLNEFSLDSVGIYITRIYARMLASGLGNKACQSIPESLNEALRMRDTGKIVVMGGTEPGHSTTTVAALLSEAINADLLLKATNVEGIYTQDPKINSNALLFDKITYADLLELLHNLDYRAGTYDVFDLTASRVLDRANIDTIVFNGLKGGTTIFDAISGSIGTTITSEHKNSASVANGKKSRKPRF